MKDFLKYTAAAALGFVFVGVLATVVGVIAIIGIAASSMSTRPIADNSVLVLRLSGALDERSSDDVFGQLIGSEAETMGLDEMMEAITAAKDNERIEGIYIESGVWWADAPATVQALRDRLADFKQSGKWIVAYADHYTQMGYYVCSVADKVVLNPKGLIDWQGLASQTIFVKDLLAKIGVKMQVVKVGKYKSATEMFTGETLSDDNREQTTAYLQGMWSEITSAVAASRGLQTEQLNAYADSFIALNDGKDYVALGLVDTLLYADEMKAEVKRMLDIKQSKTISQVTPEDLCAANSGSPVKGDEVAVYYAVGDVVDKASMSLGTKPCIAADRVCADLESLAADDDVKAVVVRVNSGGGSAYASEQIWHAVAQLRQKKPVVVSMGGMAASGGYYLACGANCIYAEPTTLTGSIGIFGLVPDVSQLLTDKLGLHFDHVATNKHSNFGSAERPLTTEETQMLTAYIERGYKLFVERVADGRGMSFDAVDSIAQGRVWIGRDAMERHLVDSLGGIDDAISTAASLAKLDEYHTQHYPAKPTWMEQLLEATTPGGNYLDDKVRQVLGEHYAVYSLAGEMSKWDRAQARLPYYIYIR